METYLFTVRDGTGEIYREDVLAVQEADALELADAAMKRPSMSETWAVATLTDPAGRVVWEVAHEEPLTHEP